MNSKIEPYTSPLKNSSLGSITESAPAFTLITPKNLCMTLFIAVFSLSLKFQFFLISLSLIHFLVSLNHF